MAAGGGNDDRGRGEISPQDREAMRKRSSEIGKQLDAVQSRRGQSEVSARARNAAFGDAFKFAAELIVGVVVGGGAGYLLDKQLGTAPWLMIVLVILGFAAGMLNVIRAARKAQAENEPLQRAAPSVADDDEK